MLSFLLNLVALMVCLWYEKQLSNAVSPEKIYGLLSGAGWTSPVMEWSVPAFGKILNHLGCHLTVVLVFWL